jgi:hypothetical protein
VTSVVQLSIRVEKKAGLTVNAHPQPFAKE